MIVREAERHRVVKVRQIAARGGHVPHRARIRVAARHRHGDLADAGAAGGDREVRRSHVEHRLGERHPPLQGVGPGPLARRRVAPLDRRHRRRLGIVVRRRLNLGRRTGVAGQVGDRILRHLDGDIAGVLRRDRRRPHPVPVRVGRGVLGERRGGAVFHRDVAQHEAVHLLAEGERRGERRGAVIRHRNLQRRRSVVHHVAVLVVAFGRRRRRVQLVAGVVLDVVIVREAERHRVVKVRQIAARGGHVPHRARIRVAARHRHGDLADAGAAGGDREVRRSHVEHRLGERHPPLQGVGPGPLARRRVAPLDRRHRRRLGIVVRRRLNLGRRTGVAGQVGDRILRHLDGDIAGVLRRDRRRPHPVPVRVGRGVLGERRGGAVFHRDVAQHEAVHLLAEGERRGDAAAL